MGLIKDSKLKTPPACECVDSHSMTSLVIYIVTFFLAVEVQFSEVTYIVSETGPAIQVCVNITGGTVGPGGLEILVRDDGGTATGKKWMLLMEFQFQSKFDKSS